MIVATVLDQAGDQLGGFIPRLGGALLLLVVGVVVARVVARLVGRGLRMAGLDSTADRWGVGDVLERAGLGRSLARVIAVAVRISLTVVVVFAALSLLGLQFLSQSLNEGVLFLPKVLAALALVLIGVVLAAFLRAWIERTSAQLDFPVAIGPVVQVLVIILFGLCAAAQAGVTVAPLTAVAIVLLGAIAFTLALAFGLGAREIARSLTSGRYARDDFEVGQTIRVGDMRGEIIRIDGAATTLKAGEVTIRIPNSILVERIVIVEAADQPSA
jgi:small-conductance mechanosensitive channel